MPIHGFFKAHQGIETGKLSPSSQKLDSNVSTWSEFKKPLCDINFLATLYQKIIFFQF